ncbi:ATP-binding protein [Thalassobaculum sp.]|uniref:AAA family ATPase n=1 Tax=Thalassobaculum sp. TaxID=2022740 RepID=UPI0032EF522B
MCGKIAAGKSTLARRLAAGPATVLIAEDEWLPRLYPDGIGSLDDYVRCSGRLRAVMGPHVVALLRAGVSVVLDFPANTIASRQWMRGIAEAADVPRRLYWLDVPDATCKARLRARNAGGTHPFAPTEADFDLFTSYFVPPSEDDGPVIVVHEGEVPADWP